MSKGVSKYSLKDNTKICTSDSENFLFHAGDFDHDKNLTAIGEAGSYRMSCLIWYNSRSRYSGIYACKYACIHVNIF